jgi:outer membrane lipoprotein carrier protein
MKIFITFLLINISLIAGIFDFNTISSDFNQTITNDENSKITYEGSFYATTESKALWIYKSPIEKKIYFNKNQVVIVEPDLEQVIVTNLQNIPNLTELLKSSKKIKKDLYEAIYEDMKYEIVTSNEQITKITYKDRLDNRISIDLFNQSINTFLDENLFKIQIPKGYDVVTQ